MDEDRSEMTQGTKTTLEGSRVEILAKNLVFRVIGLIYSKSCTIYNPSRRNTEDSQGLEVHDSKRSVQSLIRQVNVLQHTLDRVEDDDEQRALEEDITGKILLACWHGIRFEVEQVVTKVVDRIVNDKTASSWMRWTRAGRLEEFGKIFEDAIDEQPDDGQRALERVFGDAEAGASKHQILLAARAARKSRNILEGGREGGPDDNTA
ncbi:hypothetical protein V8B97DRAFT_389515 [Scleroderma yunnanense]